MLSTYHIPTTKIRAKQKSTLFNPLNPPKRFSGKFLGIDYAMLPNCEWNQKYKKQPWSNVECFAFGPKDKNQSPFHGEKTQMTKWFFGRRLYQHSKTIFNGRDATLRVRSKWLIINVVSLFWADVKYHVPTGAGFSPWNGERFLSFWRCHRPRWGGRRWWCGVDDSSLCVKSDMPQR